MTASRAATLALLLAATARAAPAQKARAARPSTPSAGDSLRQAVRAYRVGHEGSILRELNGLLAIPNVASDRENIQRNANRLVEMFTRRGLQSRLLPGDSTPPAVYAELAVPGATRTIVFYAHYDGQPVDRAEWRTDPWNPVLLDRPAEIAGRVIRSVADGDTVPSEARLYARSAADDKSPIVAMLAALDALRAAGRTPGVNLKFFLEGEEEAGSPHLRHMLERYADLLAADAWILCDGPVHQSRRPQVVFGARGVLGLELTVFGASRAMHSGHYGNWVPNPAAMLASILAGMRDPSGRITVAGFSSEVRPLTAAERAALARVPRVDEELRRSLGLAWSEGDGSALVQRIMLPALNVRGLASGHVGAEATNAIPTTARASIDFRLVPDQTLEHVRRAVEAHLRHAGYFVVHDDPDLQTRADHPRIVKLEWGDGYPAVRTPLELPVSRAVVRVLDDATEGRLVVLPMLGGSLPMYIFREVLHTPLVVVPMANHDDNQHAANENLRMQNLWDGIEIYSALMVRLGSAWR